MFKLISGAPREEWYPVTVSTAFVNGGLTYWASGELIPADATSGDHAGIIRKDILATDDDYAVARKVMVEVPKDDNIFEADVGTGTLLVTMIGQKFDLTADGASIDVTATAKQVVTVVGFVSATKALVKINSVITNAEVATT